VPAQPCHRACARLAFVADIIQTWVCPEGTGNDTNGGTGTEINCPVNSVDSTGDEWTGRVASVLSAESLICSARACTGPTTVRATMR